MAISFQGCRPGGVYPQMLPAVAALAGKPLILR
jgi:hypothetical protein